MKIPPKIALVGAGQLGSRYLQGLAQVPQKLSISVIDTSNNSIERAKERLRQIKMNAPHEIQFFSATAQVYGNYDLAIVATSANSRVGVVSALSNRLTIKALILEKVLAQSIENVKYLQSKICTSTLTWVNTPRRAMIWHKQIKMLFTPINCDAIRVQISGGRWGLACNAIHFIDLVCWWRDAHATSHDSKQLTYWTKSKRVGFEEVFGTLKIFFNDGSTLDLTCTDDENPLLIEVESCQGHWLINEKLGTAIGPESMVINGKLDLQSELTSTIVDEILSKGSCDLPSLAESVPQHCTLLKALNEHWNATHAKSTKVVPIT